MTHLVTSTADILAIFGGVTTLVGAIFAAVRLSRCQTVSCCWGGFKLVNKPIPVPAAAAAAVPPGEGGTALTHGDSQAV